MSGPAQDAFARGDYQAAARLASDPVLKGLALIMIGNPLDGLPLVSGIDPASPAVPSETAAVIAFGHWLAGKADEARTLLASRQGDRLATAFWAMLSSGPIPCLFQSARAPLLASCKKVDGFDVTTIGMGGQDCDIDLEDCDEAALEEVLSQAAFLFGFDFAGPPPRRPRNCRVPYLIHLTDPDVHVLTGLNPVRRYERAIAGTSGQAASLTAITGVETVSAPLFGGLSAFHPSLAPFGTEAEARRDCDLFFSGSFGTPIYHEKPARFFAVSQIPDNFRIELFDGTNPLPDYAARLRSARFALVSVRAPGSFSTRAMQALECGAFVLCEADSGVLDYFPGENWGVFTYRPEHIGADIASHLARYDGYAARLRPRTAAIRERLSALSPGTPKAEERWLKYAAFQALLIKQAGPLAPRPRCIEPALDWFTVRGFPSPAAGDPAASRHAAYTALAIKAREDADPPADWLSEDGGFTPLAKPAARPPVLQRDFAGAFLRIAEAWADRDRAGFEAAAEEAWQNRGTYQDQALDGLAVPDFWLGVFLNRLGLPLGRLYETAIAARTGESQPGEAGLLLGALGMSGAERAWADGNTDAAMERADQVLAIDPANHAATTMAVLCVLGSGFVPSETVLDGWHGRIGDYPWHLPRVMALLTGHAALDGHFAAGLLHETYLRFVQRMRKARPLLSPAQVPAGAAAYLAWKLDLDAAATADDVLNRLRRDGLLLTDEPTASRVIVEPVLAALKA